MNIDNQEATLKLISGAIQSTGCVLRSDEPEVAEAVLRALASSEPGEAVAVRVREALDRESCPDHFMRVAYEAALAHPPTAATPDGVKRYEPYIGDYPAGYPEDAKAEMRECTDGRWVRYSEATQPEQVREIAVDDLEEVIRRLRYYGATFEACENDDPLLERLTALREPRA